MGYDERTRTLEVEFHAGRVYQYADVEPSLFEWLLKVPQKGAVFNRLVRDKYLEIDVTPAPEPQDLLAMLQESVRKGSAGADFEADAGADAAEAPGEPE
jgi:hypothetical protein